MADKPTPDEEPTPARHTEKHVLYFNGFGMGFGSSDISIQLKLDNVDIVELKASYTTAKTFAEALALTIEKFEKVTQHDIMTITQVTKAMRSNPIKPVIEE